jgi:hypothetical protein
MRRRSPAADRGGEVGAVELDAAGGRRVEPDDQPRDGRFAAA